MNTADRLYRVVLSLLPVTLFLCLSVVILLFLFDAPDGIADRFFKPAFILFALGLLGYALAQLTLGLRRRFSFSMLLYALAALLFGLMALKVAAVEPTGRDSLPLASGLYALLLLLVWWWQGRTQETGERKREQDNDPGIRGSVSIFVTGSERYSLVQRHPDPDTPASRFQKRLLRYIERKTGKRLLAFSGDGCDYWKVPSELSRIELMVIGPGFNTRSRLAPDTSWILRIRETAPHAFTAWMARHFPEGCSRRRDLPGGVLQTQFTARCVEDERALLRQEIEPPDLDRLSGGLSPSRMQQLLDALEAESEEKAPTPERLH